jgi:hypothetical protein
MTMTGGRGPAHPSYLELDRLALGAPAAPETAAHVAACDRCRAHLDGLGQAPALPAALRERASSTARLAWWRGRLLATTGLAMAVVALVVWKSTLRLDVPDAPPSVAPAADGSKGLPSVWIYVKHDGELALWDGHRPLAAGDRLRFKIDPQDLTHVDVFTRDEGGARAMVPVFGGDLAAGAITTLPGAWQLDASAGRQSLIVVLSKRAISAREAARFVDGGAPAGIWLRRFELRAEPSP